jgi:hypothetical protein
MISGCRSFGNVHKVFSIVMYVLLNPSLEVVVIQRVYKGV